MKIIRKGKKKLYAHNECEHSVLSIFANDIKFKAEQGRQFDHRSGALDFVELT